MGERGLAPASVPAIFLLFSSGKEVQALLLSKGFCRHVYNWKLLDWRPKACQGCHCCPVSIGNHLDLFSRLHAALENPHTAHITGSKAALLKYSYLLLSALATQPPQQHQENVS